MLRIAMLALACTLAATGGSAARADTISVPNDFATVQGAINAAIGGDEVVVEPGVYGAVFFGGKAITVRSSSGPAVTTLMSSGTVVRFLSGEGPDSVLEGFTISNGTGTLVGPDLIGGGVRVFNSSPKILDCVIDGNTADFGGGMHVWNGSPLIDGCLISNNSATVGGGIHCQFGGSPTIRSCTIELNDADFGAGMHTFECDPSVNGCMFKFNIAAQDGGGMYNNTSDIVVTNCVFRDNDAIFGGGMVNHSTTAGAPSIINCGFRHNAVSALGGAIYSWGMVTPTVSNSFARSNGGTDIVEASGAVTTVRYCNVGGWTGAGGNNIDVAGQFADDDLRLTAASPHIDAGSNALADDCLPDRDGNGRVFDGTVDIGAYEFGSPLADDADGDGVVDTCDVCSGDDVFDADGDGVPDDCDACPDTSAGAAVDAEGCPTIVNIDTGVAYPTIQAAINDAVNGEVIELADGTYKGPGNRNLSFGGRAITLRSASGTAGACVINCESASRGFRFDSGETASSVLESLTIREGAAAVGAGIWCDGSANPTIRDCRISNNLALAVNSMGGGLACTGNGSPRFIGCVFINNSAVDPALGALGGGVYVSAGSPVFVDCPINSNALGGDGFASNGAAVSITGGSPTFTNCRSTSNSASLPAACVFVSGGIPVFSQCTIAGNSTSQGGVTIAGGTAIINGSIIWGNNGIGVSDLGGFTIINASDIQGGWSGAGSGNISVNPQFADGAKRLSAGSPCIDAADAALLPADVTDQDGDGDTAESLPLDIDGSLRDYDGDEDQVSIPDMGAFEYGSMPPSSCPQDLDDSGDVGFADLLAVLASWGPCAGECPEDFDDSGDVGFTDLLAVLSSWGLCP